MGGASYGREGVHAAEVIGVAGVEKYFDDYLRDPANGQQPLELSLDLTVQAASERVLDGGMKLMNAKGATSVLMDVHTGEVISARIIARFRPQRPPACRRHGRCVRQPAVQPVGAGRLRAGFDLQDFRRGAGDGPWLVNADTVIDTSGPMKVGGFRIGEFRGKNYGKQTVTGIIVHSSNRGTGRLALEIGAERQQEFLKSLGFFEPTAFEIVEASGGKPLLPQRWHELSTVTDLLWPRPVVQPDASGGRLCRNREWRAQGHADAAQAIGPSGGPARDVRACSGGCPCHAARRGHRRHSELRRSARLPDRRQDRHGGQTQARGVAIYEDKVIATFASIFPAHDPKYVLIVTLDEPVETSGDKPRRTAGWTAVPVAAEMVRRVAPLLGLRPTVEPDSLAGITLSSSN